MLKNLELRGSEVLEHCKQNLTGHPPRNLEDSYGSNMDSEDPAQVATILAIGLEIVPVMFWQRIQQLCSFVLRMCLKAKLKNNELIPLVERILRQSRIDSVR